MYSHGRSSMVCICALVKGANMAFVGCVGRNLGISHIDKADDTCFLPNVASRMVL